MKQKKNAWSVRILLGLAMTVFLMLGAVSVQAETKGSIYYWWDYRVIDMNNQLVEEVVLHEGETLVFTLGVPLEDGTYEAAGENCSFSGGEEWRITTWTHPIEGYSGLNEYSVEWCYENEHVKVWEELATNKRIICVKGKSVTDASDDYNLSHFGGIDFSGASIIASIPITVLPAEPGVTYPSAGDERPYDLFDSREEAYQYVRKLIGWHINEEITACYPLEDVDDTEIGYDLEKVLGFYTDQKGMNPSGDYLLHTGAGYLGQGSREYVTWRDTEYACVSVNYSRWAFNTTYEQEQWVDQKIKELWADGGALSYTRSGSDYDKVIACMKWIDENTSHQTSYESLAHSAYSALNRGWATCEGLAALLDRMLSEVGVSSRILMNNEAGAHTYNIVLVDGKYYYCDPTTGATLKGSNNFVTGELQEQYQDENFQKLILSRVSATDYDPNNNVPEGLVTASDGKQYFYENGIKQGTEGRGKEVYDPVTDAWYWLDAISGGAVAKNKDVYQESAAGIWGDNISVSMNGAIYPGLTTGKWVHYDENGHMVKGWYTNDKGDKYFFDYTYGTMMKGYATIDETEYYFNVDTGVLERTVATDIPENGFKTIDGNEYWYENYQRMGYSHIGLSYRGKEIYDPSSDAWYWLDNVDGGKKAVSKDVYQNSEAGQWGEYYNASMKKIGKWVRYDENGHMIKGWSKTDDGTYYFDPTFGTMAKGEAVIDGETYYFDMGTGILIQN